LEGYSSDSINQQDHLEKEEMHSKENFQGKGNPYDQNNKGSREKSNRFFCIP
jgi:hypothetical protein